MKTQYSFSLKSKPRLECRARLEQIMNLSFNNPRESAKNSNFKVRLVLSDLEKAGLFKKESRLSC
jgi:hypothetical protein